MPGLITRDIKKIMLAIEENKFDFERLRDFKEKYIYSGYKNNTTTLVELIMNKETSENVKV